MILPVHQQLAQQNFGLDLQGALETALGVNQDINGICQDNVGFDANHPDSQAFITTTLGGRALTIDGTSGSFVSTPDAASLQPTTSLDIRVEYEHSGAGNASLMAKWVAGTGNRSFAHLVVPSFGVFQYQWSTLGTNTLAENGSVGAIYPVARVTHNATNIIIQQGDTMDGPFVTLNTIPTGSFTIFDSTAPLELGAMNNGTTSVINGRIFQARYYVNGVLQANPDFRFLAPGTTSFDDDFRTWTLNGGAAIT